MKRSLWIGCVLLLVAGGAVSATPIVRSWFHERFPQLGINGPQVQRLTQQTLVTDDSLPLVNIDLPPGGKGPVSQPQYVPIAQYSPAGMEGEVRLAQAILPVPQQGQQGNSQPGNGQFGALPPVRSQEGGRTASPYPQAPSGPTSRLSQSGGIGGVPSEGIGVPSASSTDRISIPQASLIFKRDITVYAPADGLIMQLNVDDGTNSKEGETLIIIDSRVAEAEVRVQTQERDQASLKANDDSNILFAKAARELAEKEWVTSNELVASGAESRSDSDKKGLELKKARLQVQVSEIDKKKDEAAVGVAEAKLDAANVQVGLRTIKAQFDGLVNEVKKKQSEFVRTGDPILQFTDMTRLRVVGSAKTTVPPNQLLNAKSRITIEIAPGVTKVVEGIVGFVSPRTDSAKDVYRVWVEIANEQLPDGQFLLRGGMAASMEVFPTR